MNLSKYASFRLPRWKSKDAEFYWSWCKAQRRPNYEWHHLLKRQHGHLLIVQIPQHQHRRIHSLGYEDGEYEELFVQAIQNLLNYIHYLIERD